MSKRKSPLSSVLHHLRWQVNLTWVGLLAERISRAFWPFWSLLIFVGAILMLGLHEVASIEAVWIVGVLAAAAALGFAVYGVSRFRWPSRQEAIDRIDASLKGYPLSALADTQAIGDGDANSELLWKAHLKRMRGRAAEAKRVSPDLRLASRDLFGLRYVALLFLVVGLLFGSIWRAGSVGDVMGGNSAALAGGPTWEGWIEPPAYTGLPSLYLNDQSETVRAPVGSLVTLRLYGEVGALSVAETVSGRTEDIGAATDSAQNFEINSDGELRINGPGGQTWDVTAIPDEAPAVSLVSQEFEVTFDGQMSQPFSAQDDYGVAGGVATFELNMAEVDRSHGLSAKPDPRERIELDLPLPITGGRDAFTETLIENLSQHPWAHLPVTLTLEVFDEQSQTGKSEPYKMDLPARRFFDPLAASVIEQRRDLLWSKSNAKRVSQILRAISHAPEQGLFRSDTAFLRMRVILRRLETLEQHASLTDEAQEEIAQALWDLAIVLEDGDIGDALERMRAAQERLSEAMRNGASDEEIARLMQELREATNDFLRQRAQQAQRDGESDEQGEQQGQQNAQNLSQQDLQDMMDRIQELMEQGRFAEAQQALEEFQQMMENMRVTQGQGQGGQSEGQQAMEGLAETLREQQGLSDDAFRDLQEQYNPGAQAGESQGNRGRSGGQGEGQSHEGQGSGDGQQPGSGEGDQQSAQGQGGGGDALSDRQEALRRELQRQREALPNLNGEASEDARRALDRAGEAMQGAEDALRQDDLPEAIDRQAEAMDALREGMRNLGQALAENNQSQAGQGQAQSQNLGQFGEQDPLGRTQRGFSQGDGNFEAREDVYRRAGELLDEIRKRSGDASRPEIELDYLRRLLDRF
ncbi:MAG: TIGR02302 family protein [Pseudomonadota bacterium]